MTWILEGAALFCVVYYVILTVYAGFSVSFSLFWPALSSHRGIQRYFLP